MQLVTSISKMKHSDEIIDCGLYEVILEHRLLSKFGELSTEELIVIAERCQALNIKVVLSWDILMVEENFDRAKSIIESINVNLFHAIRAQDPGAINYIIETMPQMKVQLQVERGSNNIESLKMWEKLIGDNLDRIILSTEVAKESVKEFVKQIDIDFEILGLGRILLFYSPRNLLSAAGPTGNIDENLIANVKSDESPNHNMDVIENIHGTFMFHHKDHFLLDNLEEIIELGVKFLRIDVRFEKSNNILSKISNLYSSHQFASFYKIKEFYSRKVMKGFYTINRTDAIFKKLKNYRIQKIDNGYIGDVLEVKKNEYIAIHIKSNQQLKIGDNISILTPDGKNKTSSVSEIKNSTGESIQSTRGYKLILLKHISGVSVRSRAYLSILE